MLKDPLQQLWSMNKLTAPPESILEIQKSLVSSSQRVLWTNKLHRDFLGTLQVRDPTMFKLNTLCNLDSIPLGSLSKIRFMDWCFRYQFLQIFPHSIPACRKSWESMFVPVEIAMREHLKLPAHKCHVRHHLLHPRSHTDMCQCFGSL